MITDGYSHVNIAERYILRHDPDAIFGMDQHSTIWWDTCYDWMFKNGFGRVIISNYRKTLVITASKDYPDLIIPVHSRAIKYAKNSENIQKVECDRTGRILWSREDVL